MTSHYFRVWSVCRAGIVILKIYIQHVEHTNIHYYWGIKKENEHDQTRLTLLQQIFLLIKLKCSNQKPQFLNLIGQRAMFLFIYLLFMTSFLKKKKLNHNHLYYQMSTEIWTLTFYWGHLVPKINTHAFIPPICLPTHTGILSGFFLGYFFFGYFVDKVCRSSAMEHGKDTRSIVSHN